MANKISWITDKSVAVASFDIQRSVNKGISFTALVNILADPNGANYDKQTKKYFYLDAGGNPGDIYTVTATGDAGTSKPAYAITAPDPPDLCVIIGYVRDAFGFVEQETSVHVTAFGSPGERWIKNPNGLVAQHPNALGLVNRSAVIKPDAGGIWQVELVRRAYAKVEIPSLDFILAFEVPDKAGPVNIRDIPQLRGQALALFSEMTGAPGSLPES